MSVTRADIVAGLRQVGIAPGDLVFAHSSLSAFGHVEGGADTVVDALLEAVGPEGTLVLPTFTWRDHHDQPTVVFDLARKPCETGRIPETFRQRLGVRRSKHVCHSVAACGPLADAVMGGPRSFGVGSSLHCLYELDSWYLFLGVGFGVCSALHMAEELIGVPYRYHRDFAGSTVILPDGTIEPADSLEYVRRPGAVNDFLKMGPLCETAGILRRTTVGQATITNTRMRALVDLALGYLREDPLFLLTAESRTAWE